MGSSPRARGAVSTILRSYSTDGSHNPDGFSQYDFRVVEAYRVQGASDFLAGVYYLRDILPEVDRDTVDSSYYGSYVNFGHSEKYYRRRKDIDAYYDLCSELFANCCSAIATNDVTAIKALKLVVPNFFEEVIALFG